MVGSGVAGEQVVISNGESAGNVEERNSSQVVARLVAVAVGA
jgi:microcompartment protein CcmK/EutM